MVKQAVLHRLKVASQAIPVGSPSFESSSRFGFWRLSRALEKPAVLFWDLLLLGAEAYKQGFDRDLTALGCFTVLWATVQGTTACEIAQ